ncbi:Fatty acid desaturase; Delta-9 fatty acid desaturase [hydrothermal vent metagenome]|uniref:Fatty acid desaturase Delta-9 fatty acid desaturase n=1 Tax=hydrothermal vent metagenome TaxID=652676 RepID=A0A3B0ZZL5_9ZZZZ
MNLLLDGLLNLSAWGYVGATFLVTHITIVAVTIFLHRSQSHNSLTLHPIISHIFRFWLWMTTGIVTREWVAVHRKHHVKCETDDDPHSPQTRGLKKVLWQGYELYRAEANQSETLEKYGNGTPDDWIERKLYSRFPWLGIALLLPINITLFGVIGLTIFAIQMIWIPFWAAGVINGMGHYLGYRNFETPDASRNISPWGILIGGEELHNNHHSYATSAKLSNKWWEIDLGWFYIRCLEILKLAKVKKLAARAIIVTDKHSIDIETVRAVIRNRFYILKLYARKVTKPMLKQQQRNNKLAYRKLLRRASKLLTREDIILDGDKRRRLDAALNYSHTIETVYQFKQQLKEIWVKSSHDQVRRVQRLQAWCVEAEKSGIEVLQEFAFHLRGYTLQLR